MANESQEKRKRTETAILAEQENKIAEEKRKNKEPFTFAKALSFVLPVLFLLSIYSLIFYFPVAEPRTESIIENRVMQQFPPARLKDIADGSFQTKFEKAIADQAFFRDPLLVANSKKDTFISDIAALVLKPKASYGKVITLFKENALYELHGKEYLLQYPFIYNDKIDRSIASAAEYFEKVKEETGANIVSYSIEPIVMSDANPLNSMYPGYVGRRYGDTLLKSLPKSVTALSLRYWTIEENLADFYITDHHFNGNTAQKIYNNSYDALSKFSALSPRLNTEVIEVPNSLMRGSKARSSLYDKLSEMLTSAEAQIPEYKMIMNGKEESARSNRASILAGNVLSEEALKYTSVYAEYFGFDFAEIIYQNDSAQTGRKLMIIGPSYTQTFEGLLASHYKTTFVIDPRYWPEAYGEKFDIIKYTKEHEIDDILFLAQPQQYAEWLLSEVGK